MDKQRRKWLGLDEDYIVCGDVTFHRTHPVWKLIVSAHHRLDRLVIGHYYAFLWSQGQALTYKELLSLVRETEPEISMRTFRRILKRLKLTKLKKGKPGRKRLQ